MVGFAGRCGRGALRAAVVAVLAGVCGVAMAGDPSPAWLYQSQGAAYGACMSTAGWLAVGSPSTVSGSCGFAGSTGVDGSCASGNYAGHYSPSTKAGGLVDSYAKSWCLPAACTAGQSKSSGQFDGDFLASGAGDTCNDGCLVSFHPVDGVGSVCVVGGSCSSFGQWVTTGARCTASYVGSEVGALPSVPPIEPYKPTCDHGSGSCYDPKAGYCGTTQSGESVCAGGPAPGGGGNPPPEGGCVAGATGAVCVGGGVPSDPPVPRDTPPDSTTSFRVKDGSGGSVVVEVPTYSGTSPGSGGAGGGGGSVGGSGSNANGGGNSGDKGTDDKGQCPDGKVPTASGCSGTYRDDGCDAPPACFGDAVLCGIAVNTHKTACNPASGSSSGTGGALKGYPDADPMDTSGDPTASSITSEVDVGDQASSLDSSGFGYSVACPLQDMSFEVMGRSIVVPMASKCGVLEWVRYLVLALAYFVGAKIIAGVK